MNESIFIPEYRLDSLRSKIDSMNRKAKKLGLDCHASLNISNRHLEKFEIPISRFEIKKYSVFGYDVTVDGLFPKINNWIVIAKIEHLESGDNFIKAFQEIPEIYRSTAADCDHCQLDRNRKTTVVIQNLNTLEYKQVGLTCLADYIRCENAESILNWYASLDLKDYSNLDDNFNPYKSDSMSVKYILNITLGIIAEFGYISKSKAQEMYKQSTADIVLDYLDDKLDVKLSDMSNQADLIISTLTNYFSTANLSDYEHNLSIIIQNEYIPVRLLGYLVSIPSYYNNLLERLEREKQSSMSDFIGNIKDKITVNVTVDFITPIDGFYGVTYLCKFTDNSGNKLVWFSSNNPDFNVGDNINLYGTVKDHKVYQNEKQTVLTRCKVKG